MWWFLPECAKTFAWQRVPIVLHGVYSFCAVLLVWWENWTDCFYYIIILDLHMKKRMWFSPGVPISTVTLSHSFLTLVDFWQTFSKAVLYSTAEESSCTHCMYVCKTHDLKVEKVSLASYACKHMHTHTECKSSHLLIVTWHLTPNQTCLTYQSLSTLARVCHENIGLLCLRLQWTFKISNIVCLDIFWTTEPFVIKLGSVIHHHKPERCLQG